jgi:catechol 2,3-dioxygenase-like lactoylglutathione lyase family enzyme
VSIELNHLIVFSRDKHIAATFLTETLGLPEPKLSGPFLTVPMSNSVTLDFFDSDREVVPQHLAFLVSEPELEQILQRIRARGQMFWADPFHRQKNQINFENGGRGFYFEDPSGHNLEVLSSP